MLTIYAVFRVLLHPGVLYQPSLNPCDEGYILTLRWSGGVRRVWWRPMVGEV